jgi:hypothetical protein
VGAPALAVDPVVLPVALDPVPALVVAQELVAVAVDPAEAQLVRLVAGAERASLASPSGRRGKSMKCAKRQV